MGGEAGCRSLATAFYARVAGDPELRPLFPGKSIRCATEEFSAFLIQFLGGDEQQTQYRWWLSLKESHARFKITESQRLAWLNQMDLTLRQSDLEPATQDALLQFFASSSTYVVGGQSGTVNEPELAERWDVALAMDNLVESIVEERDAEVLQGYLHFADRPSVFVGVLTRMMQSGRPALIHEVMQAIARDRELGRHLHAGKTLLHYAAAAACPEVVAQLLDVGVHANVLDTGNHTPLYAAANGRVAKSGPEIVRLLVHAGADVDHCGGVTRATPLHMAARRGNVEIAKALIDAGASLLSRDCKGCTPLDRAIRCRKYAAVQILQVLIKARGLG